EESLTVSEIFRDVSASLDMTKKPENQTEIALVQMRCGADLEKNFSRALDFIREAAKKGAQIVCLPELFRSQYFCQSEDHKKFELAEEVHGRSTSRLKKR